MSDTTMTPAQLLASIKKQARRAVYDERDDSVHFEKFHWIKDEAIRQRVLIERAIIRRAVRDILAHEGDYCITVYDGMEYALKCSRDLDEIMANIGIGPCYAETIVIRKTSSGPFVGEKLGFIFLVYGNGGWDVMADRSDATPLNEILQEGAEKLAAELGNLL